MNSPSEPPPATCSEGVETLRRHIEARLDAVVVEPFPFPHMIVSDIFPADAYQRLLRYNPFLHNPGAEWLSRGQSDNVSSRTPYFARKQIDLAGSVEFDAPSSHQAFWRNVRDCFIEDGWFEQLIYRKYATYFDVRFGEAVLREDFWSSLKRQLFLQRHDLGFRIGPHTDLPTRIFTCIFSFPDREGCEQYGTELLSHEDPLVRCWGNDHYDMDGFVVRKVAPYRPNNMLLFFKTRQSFHAVRVIDEDVPNQRYGMQFQLHEPAGGLFRDLSAPQLMRFQPDERGR